MKQVLYISSPQERCIEVWDISKEGSLSLLQTVKTYGEVQPLTIARKKNLLYAGIRPNCAIVTYKIKKNGLLKIVHITPIKNTPNYISIDKNNEVLLCSSYGSNTLISCELNKFGIPKKPKNFFKNIFGCHSVVFSKNNNYVFTTSLKSDKIYFFIFKNKKIFLNPIQPILQSKINSGPRHIICSKLNNQFFYSINELNSTVDVWSISVKNHTVNLVQTVKIIDFSNNSDKAWGSEIKISPCENYLYAADRSKSIISVFFIDKKTKILKKITQFSTEQQPRSFDIDENGKFLISAGQLSNYISIYKISKNTGFIRLINRYKTKKGPLWTLIYKIN
ncbi:MAG TPA: beta-propeller fold lactonase family protein [Buchnera sp. (in: enterobacteria)]|nr:beta-propeller fold lactonase family protein [Buchnera sp. (in: enterobacteria)]